MQEEIAAQTQQETRITLQINKQQAEMILEMVNQVGIPGRYLEQALDLKLKLKESLGK